MAFAGGLESLTIPYSCLEVNCACHFLQSLICTIKCSVSSLPLYSRTVRQNYFSNLIAQSLFFRWPIMVLNFWFKHRFVILTTQKVQLHPRGVPVEQVVGYWQLNLCRKACNSVINSVFHCLLLWVETRRCNQYSFKKIQDKNETNGHR